MDLHRRRKKSGNKSRFTRKYSKLRNQNGVLYSVLLADMFCTNCGQPLESLHRHCVACGKLAPNNASENSIPSPIEENMRRYVTQTVERLSYRFSPAQAEFVLVESGLNEVVASSIVSLACEIITKHKRRAYMKRMILYGIILVIGIVGTLSSLTHAIREGKHTYTLYYGAIGIGALMLLYQITQYRKAANYSKKKSIV
jgi:predicted nucleic acid-binding Zn ribbon protein